MAQTFGITLERELPDATLAYNKAGVGKALFREAARLDTASRQCKVPAITAMLSENQGALIEQLKADGFDPSKMRLPPERWFSPAEGLVTVRALISHVTANLNDFKQPNPILRDLKSAEAILTVAEAAGVRFHFVSGTA